MNVVIFLGSLLGLQLISAFIYIGILLVIAWVIGNILNRDDDKWSRFFEFGNGAGLYIFIISPYVFAMIALFFICTVWFEFIRFPNVFMSSIIVVVLCSLFAVYPFSKLKGKIIAKV